MLRGVMIPHRLHIPLLCLGLVLATSLLYWPMTGHPFIAYDDGYYIVDNPRVTAGLSWAGLRWAFTTFHEANWHPLTWLSHQLDCTLFGIWAGGHHLTNLVLHLLNTLLLFLLLFRLTSLAGRSAMVAALFALHPLHVESVAWVAERKDLLCAVFVLLSLHAYRAHAGTGSHRAYLLAIVAFIGALLSKPMAVTLPFLLLLLDFWPLERWRAGNRWPLIREKVPFLILSIASSVVTIIAQKAGGAMISVNEAGIGLRLANAVVSIATYVRRSFWPSDLAVLYPFPRQIPSWQVTVSSILLAVAFMTAWRLRRHYPYLLAGILWFLGMLVPVSGLVQVGQQAMADRYTYLPAIGLCIALVWLAAETVRRWRHGPMVAGVLGLALLFGCGSAARTQLSYWQSSESLFRRTLAVTERNYVMHLNLGNELKKRGEYGAAITEYLNAVGMNPYNPDTHYYLADGLHAAGKLEEAAGQYRVVLAMRPTFSEAHNNLGATLYKQGKLAEAIQHYEQALRLNPKDELARINLVTTRAELVGKQQSGAATPNTR
jgi:hypothetical protein